MKKSVSSLLFLGLVLTIAIACVPGATPTPAAPMGVAATAIPSATPVAKATAVQPQPPAPSVQPTKPVEASYYQGKTIEILVESTAGGGTDTIARISAPFLSKYVPGNPKTIIRNIPGAAGANANNIFYEKAKPDGLTLLQNSNSPLSMQLRSAEMVKYDLTKYKFIGNVSRGQSVSMIRKGFLGRLTDPKSPPLVMGTKEGEETYQALFMWGKEFLGWNVRWVMGYGGTSEMELAFRRGELDFMATNSAFIINRLNQEGLAENLCVNGRLKGGKFIRRADFPDLRTFEEVLGDKKPTGTAWQSFVAFLGPDAVDKVLAAPPRTPDNVVSILTDAFGKMAKDPQFDQMMRKTVSDVYEVGIGKETEDVVKQILGTPPEALTYGIEMQRKMILGK